MAQRKITESPLITYGIPIAAATTIEYGHIVACDASGNAVPAADTASLTVMGVAVNTDPDAIDNSAGAAGDKTVVVKRGPFAFDNSSTSPVTAAQKGGNCYIEDSVTVASAGSNSIVAGKVMMIDTDGVWVNIG